VRHMSMSCGIPSYSTARILLVYDGEMLIIREEYACARAGV